MCAAILLELVRHVLILDRRSYLLRYRLWGDTEPCIFRHPDAFVVLVPDFEALEPVSVDVSLDFATATDLKILTFVNAQGIGQRSAIDGCHLVPPPSRLGRCPSLQVWLAVSILTRPAQLFCS